MSMIPSAKQLAAQLVALVEKHPDKSTSEIAAMVGYSPLFIINAISEGEKRKWLVNDMENDKLSLGEESIDWGEADLFGTENTRIQDEILRLIADKNSKEDDVEVGQLQFWGRGILPAALEIAIESVKKTDLVSSYEVVDPYDDKSTYEFLTLKNHMGEMWGLKQFKKPPKKK